MKKVFTAPDLDAVHLVQGLLKESGFECSVLNSNLTFLAGEIPTIETWPELWLLDDTKLPAAMEILRESNQESDVSEPWFCAVCNEKVPGSFACCWNCSTQKTDRDANPDKTAETIELNIEYTPAEALRPMRIHCKRIVPLAVPILVLAGVLSTMFARGLSGQPQFWFVPFSASE